MNKDDPASPVSTLRSIDRSDAPAPGRSERGYDMRYPHNPLEGFGLGCNLDLRVRLAINMLQTSARYASNRADGAIIAPAQAAEDALDLAGELLGQAEARGWVAPLEDAGELSSAVRAQAKRTGSFGTLQQLEASKFAQNEQGRVVPMAPGVGPRH